MSSDRHAAVRRLMMASAALAGSRIGIAGEGAPPYVGYAEAVCGMLPRFALLCASYGNASRS